MTSFISLTADILVNQEFVTGSCKDPLMMVAVTRPYTPLVDLALGIIFFVGVFLATPIPPLCISFQIASVVFLGVGFVSAFFNAMDDD